jgi:hypothetical protein
MTNRSPRLTVRGDPGSWLMGGGAAAALKAEPDEITEPIVGGPTTLPPPTGPPRARLGFGDEYSCGVTEFLRRVGIGRTKLYQLLDGEIESFLLEGKRMILIASWLEYVSRRQAAERAGQLRKRRAGWRDIGEPRAV